MQPGGDAWTSPLDLARFLQTTRTVLLARGHAADMLPLFLLPAMRRAALAAHRRACPA